jgi:hypothetical protein
LGKSHNWLLDQAMHLLATRWSELSRMGGRAKQGVEGGKLKKYGSLVNVSQGQGE